MLASLNSFGYRVLYTYLPPAVAMIIEPVLITLGSCACMLAPYKALNRANAPSSSPLAVDYDKSPSHFQLLRSLRTGNFVLAALSAAILLSNILATAFAGLFSPTTRDFHINTEMQTPTTVTVQGNFTDPAQEMYYVFVEDFAGSITSATWTTPEYYVLPFYATDDGVQEYQGPSLGIGIDINCALVAADKITETCNNGEQLIECAGIRESLPTSAIRVDDRCWAHYYNNPTRTIVTTRDLYKLYTTSADSLLRSVNCPDTLFTVWAQSFPTPHNTTKGKRNYDVVILKCTMAETVVALTATVNKVQPVVKTSDIHPLDKATLYPANTAAGTRLAHTFTNVVYTGASNDPEFHDIKWLDHVLGLLNPDIWDPVLPDTSRIAAAVEDAFRRLFAINLGLYADDILAPVFRDAAATALVRRDRVEVSDVIFYISVCVLAFMIVVLAMLYLGQGGQGVGHLPRSLVGVWAHLYATEPREGGKWTYGWFEKGGRRHVGVYQVGESVEKVG